MLLWRIVAGLEMLIKRRMEGVAKTGREALLSLGWFR
jgi:hypothetical protein